MKKFRFATWCCLVAMVLNTTVVSAQGLFRTEVKNRYDLKTVSCYTCHDRVPLGTENPKQFRNDLGKVFDALLKGKKITARVAAVKELDRDDKKRMAVEAAVLKEFCAALDKLEAMKHPEAGTYKDAFKKGVIEGLKLKE